MSETSKKGKTAKEPHLTTRECQVLGYLMQGLGNKAIGRALSISPYTVQVYVQRLMRKLGAVNRTQALGLAIGLGFLMNTKTDKDPSKSS